METLYKLHWQRIDNIFLSFKRYLYNNIDFSERLIGITGARGVGKTTLMLQYLKENLHNNTNEAIYTSLDNFYFTNNTLVDFVEKFTALGGKYLFLDEVHKYSGWSTEIKTVYDHYPNLKIVFSASSMLHVYKGQADLSRRVALYTLNNLSFREYLELITKNKFHAYSLSEILNDHINISRKISSKIKPLKEFKDYLTSGMYPFLLEGKTKYQEKLYQSVLQVFESDIPEIINITSKQVHKLKLLLHVISTSAPFTPNISKLAEKTGIDRKAIYKYLQILEDARLIISLKQPAGGMTSFNKPEKLYLNNPNLMYVFADSSPDIGNVRETFFMNQVSTIHKVNYTRETDFLVDNKYYFETGGKNKTKKQIKDLPNAFIVSDDIETGFNNKIPLWLFGFLY